MLKRFLARVRLLPKILSLGILITLCFSLVLGFVYLRFQRNLWDAKRAETRDLVSSAHNSVVRYVDAVADGTMTEEEAKAAAKKVIESMRYANDNYFWINDTSPKMVMHPTNTDMYDQDLSDYEDPNGKRIFMEFVNVAETSGSGFVDYVWDKPGHSKPVPKVSYVKMVPEWDWIVGTGIYADDVQAEMAAVQRTMLGVGVGIAGVAVLLSFVLARSISDPLQLVVAGAERVAKGDAELAGMDQKEIAKINARGDELGEVGRALGDLLAYFSSKAEAAGAIAEGNLAIEVPVASDADTLGHAMVTMRESISGMAESVQGLIGAAVAGKLDTRADAAEFEGEYREIVDGVNQTMDAVIGPLNVTAEYVDRISKGDIPEKITEDYQGDYNEIKNNLNGLIDALNDVLGQLDEVNDAMAVGRLDVRGDAQAFQGRYRNIIQGLNETLDAVIAPLNVTAEYVDRISKGDIPEKITDDYQGDFNEIKNNLNQLIDSLNRVLDQTDEINDAMAVGKLDVRGDAQEFQGRYRGIVQGLNGTLDAVIAPLNVTAEYVDRISKGDIPEKITDDYQGDFNEIKNNLNGLIDSLNRVLDEMDELNAAAEAGRLDVRADASEFQGRYANIVQGVNGTLDAVVGPMQAVGDAMNRIARGDLTVKMNGKYRGDYAKLSESVDTMVVGLREMAGRMQDGAMNISSATSEILASSSQMASTTREQASAVNEVTSTVEEIQSSAEQVAQRAQGVAEAAQEAARAAQDGSMAADEAIAAMSDIRQRVDAIAENILSLSEQTQQIGEIIDTVTDIADQSNILALNAAIEAAQAGEAGKGFRVVADEVRSLAEQSRQAAAQVKVILGDIQEASNRAVMATEQGTKQVAAGSDQVERTAQTIRELSSTVEQSSHASEQIVAGVQQQTVGLDQIAVGMTDINQAAQQAAAGAEQSEKAAQDLDKLGGDLEETVDQYKM